MKIRSRVRINFFFFEVSILERDRGRHTMAMPYHKVWLKWDIKGVKLIDL